MREPAPESKARSCLTWPLCILREGHTTEALKTAELAYRRGDSDHICRPHSLSERDDWELDCSGERTTGAIASGHTQSTQDSAPVPAFDSLMARVLTFFFCH